MLAILGAVAVFAIDAHVQTTAGPRIVTADEAAVLGNVDCVLVLGCGVHPDGCPSDMLADRIAQGVALYENGTSPKLLMSGRPRPGRLRRGERHAGDGPCGGTSGGRRVHGPCGLFHLREHVPGRAMCSGRSASVSVSQKYHLYRALYVAERLGWTPTECPPICVPTPAGGPRAARSAGPKQGLLTAIVQPPPDVSGLTPLAFRQRQRHRGLRWPAANMRRGGARLWWKPSSFRPMGQRVWLRKLLSIRYSA